MSNTKNTGGAAFPTTGEQFVEGVHGIQPQSAYGMQGSEGMTLRDYFAARAMHGIVSGVSSLDKEGEERVRKDWLKSYPGRTWGQAASEQAYHIADAMLKARDL